jgi:hypothetical protein
MTRQHLIARAGALLGSALVLLLVGCGKDEAPDANASSSLPASIWSTDDLAPARQAAEVRKDAKDGEDVVVAGRAKDFNGKLAVFTLADMALVSCADMGDDQCKTPWDYCCVAPDLLAAGLVTVELHDEDGRPIRTPIKGFHGLDHLDRLQIAGKVKRDDGGNVTIVMTKMHKL